MLPTAWIVVMILVIPFSVWGIFLGWQYRDDACVNANWYYKNLDWWLLSISLFNITTSILILGLLCCHARSIFRKAFIWPSHMINLTANGVGIWLIWGAESVSGCNHNELWIFSIVIVSLTLVSAMMVLVIYIFYRCGLCLRFGKLLSIEDESPTYTLINPVEEGGSR